MRELLNAGLALTQIHTQFDPSLTSGAYEQDLFDVRRILTSKGSRWWRRFSGEYRRAESRMASVLRPPRTPELARRIQLIDAVIDAQRQLASIQEQEVLGEGLFGARWRGRESDWGALAKLTDWVQNLQDDVGSGEVPAGIIDFLADSPPVANLKPLVEPVEDAARVHTTAANVILAELEAARKVLLDLGMRNPLLNYRPLRSRRLEVVDELPEQVYRVLVEEGKSMSFAPASSSAGWPISSASRRKRKPGMDRRPATPTPDSKRRCRPRTCRRGSCPPTAWPTVSFRNRASIPYFSPLGC